MMTKDGGWKRKISTVGRDESIYFLFNSSSSIKSSALFELKITITGDKIQPLDDLERIETFYEQCRTKHIAYASCAPLGKGRYLIMPNEYNRSYDFRSGQYICNPRENPCIYHSVEKFSSTVDNIPLGAKVNPIAVTVGDKVYVLSRRNVSQYVLPEPSFEAYDPEKKKWETLTAPFFNQDIPLECDDCTRGWASTGYAVFREFIIVCFQNRRCPTQHDIYSYNTISLEWKRVHCTTTPVIVYDDGTSVFDDTNDFNGYYITADEETYDFVCLRRPALDYLVWSEEGVVIKNFIYAFVEKLGLLVSYNCTKSISHENGCDFVSFNEKVVIVRLEHPPLSWNDMGDGNGFITGAVGKIEDDLICLVKTLRFSHGKQCQPVHLTIFRILEDGGCCTRLQSFDLSLKGDELFHWANISSCFLWQPEGVLNRHHAERTSKKPSLSRKDALVQGEDGGDVYALEMFYKH